MAAPGTPVLVTSGSTLNVDAHTATTASFTPEIGVLYVLFGTVVRAAATTPPPATPTGSSGNLTFTDPIYSIYGSSKRRNFKWYFTSSTVTPTTITITYDGVTVYSNIEWHVVKVPGANVATPDGQTPVKNADNPASAATLTLTFAAFDPDTLALVYGESQATGTSSVAPNHGIGNVTNNRGKSVVSYELPAVDTTHVFTWSVSNTTGGIGLEIAGAATDVAASIQVDFYAESEPVNPVGSVRQRIWNGATWSNVV